MAPMSWTMLFMLFSTNMVIMAMCIEMLFMYTINLQQQLTPQKPPYNYKHHNIMNWKW